MRNVFGTRRHLLRLLALLGLILLPFSALADDNPIIERMSALTRAYNSQNAGAVAALYAPNAILLAPGQKAIVGRDNIAAHYAQAFAAGARDLQFKTFDIRPLNDTAAVEIGETIVQVNGQRIVGRYMHLWEVLNGELLLTRDMYHLPKVN